MKKFGIAFLPILALLSFVAFYHPATTEAQANIPCYRMQGGATNVAGAGCTYDFKSSSALTLRSGAAFSVTGFLNGGLQTAITVDESSTISPTGTVQRISSSRAVGTSAISGRTTEGRLLILVNVGSNTITLTDTGTLKLSGNIALGQYDSVSLVADGTNWIQLATANN